MPPIALYARVSTSEQNTEAQVHALRRYAQDRRTDAVEFVDAGVSGAKDSRPALDALMRLGWGQKNPAFRQVFTSLFIPDGSAQQMQWLNDLQRNTTSPENAVRIRAATGGIDVTDLLPQLRVPTLVLHCRGDAAIPFEEGRRLAAGIPGAHLVALEGRNHVILEGNPGWTRFLDEVTQFLRS